MTKNAQEFARPVANFTFPAKVCDKTDILFTNGSTISTGNMGYSWTFGDGGVSSFANPYHSYTNPGSKTVKMKVVSEFGCADSITKTLNLAEAPLANFTTAAVCNQTPTKFTFTGTKPSGAATTFSWNFAGEGTSFAESPTKLFSNVGKKMVTLTVNSDNGCSDVVAKEVNVKLQSKADFQINDVCEDMDAVFTNLSSVSAGNLAYNWKFGDSKTSSIQSPRHLYSIGGITQTYNVTLVAIVPGGCSDSITKAITVNAKPNSDFSFSPSGRLVTFNALQTNNNTTFQWDFNNGASASTPTTSYEFINYPSGKYKVCLAVYNTAGCFSQTCKQVSITGSVENINKLSGVKIYPNPNKGNFTVTVENPKKDIAIAIYNVLGEIVKTIHTDPLLSTYNIDLNVANGVYLLKVTNGGLISTQKVTVSK